ncbi:Proteophosphoglycan 5 [Rhodotorula diobovata]|uniref:Proteophosphoglycan 5 n=1 Tax=Rhodotorula diobovata TaxID=5288 RepID=A0A5C5G0M7_9BASI|nr:Proteophosphoglycan 5 [Rhodotorula diobovata]
MAHWAHPPSVDPHPLPPTHHSHSHSLISPTSPPPPTSTRRHARATLGNGYPLGPPATATDGDQGEDALMRTLSPEPLPGPDRDPGGNSGRTPLAPMDADGDDTRMRNLSEEPAPVSTSSNLAPQAALSSTTTPAAVAGSGVGVTRNPSLRARDAFSRLRIGSFGAAPRPALPPNSGGAAAGAGAGGSSVPGSPTSDAGFSSGGSGSRRGSVATAGGAGGGPLHHLPDTRHQSPAASFLSAFSPPSSAGSAGRSPSPPLPLTSHRRAAYAPFVLPPRGDERGYRLCATHDGDDDARGWEYELGRVLGQGGMGLVREAVRRRRGRGRLGARGREGEGEGEGEKDEGHDEDDETRVAVKIIPRRHPHFVSLAALREAMGAGALDRDHATVHLHPAPALAPSPALATPLAGSAGAAGPRRASLRGVALGVDRFGMGAGGGAGGGGDLERSRSTSSPVRPLLGMRGSSMAPLESPAPSPPAVDEALLGTSAPRLEGGYFAAIERERERGRERGGAAREGGGGAGGDADGGEVDLLDLLLQRELSLWRQLSRLVPGPGSDSGAAWRTTRWTGRGGHPHIVALLGTHRTAEFDYVFMPLAEGGTLLEYVTRPETRDRGPSDASSAASASTSSSASTPSSRSPSRRSASRGRTRDGNGNGNGTGPHATRRPRASIPIAGTASSLSPPASSSHAAPARAPQGLALPDAGEAFLQVAEAVRWLHCDAGVVHRDLKLENVVGCWEVRPLGAPPPKHEHERGRSRSKGGAKDRRSKTRRVWKLADFGLAEVMPQQAPGSAAGAGAAVRGVQPLAALARAGSLSRPGGAGGAPAGPAPHHSLAASVGPGAPLSSSAAAAAAAAGPGQGMSSSAFLPSPHQRPPSAALAPGAGASNSPLSALLHPVGSLPYSSPEAMRSPVPIVHPSIDMWALGCVLHALVAARLPIWDEWELRLRVRLVKGEWDVPAELDPDLASDDDEVEERAMALEVLRGCLDVDPAQRWDIRRVCDSAWLQRVRAREAEARSVAAAAFTQQQQQQQQQQQLQQSLSPTSPTATRPPSRGRPPTRGSAASSSYGFSSPSGGPPPAPSAGAREPSSTPASSATGGTKSKSRSRTRLTTRSSSRSSAYAHQLGALGGSESQDRERRERGRSERRARWDEAASGSGTGGGGGRRMRSSSRASGAATEDETAAAVAQGLRRGRSASRTGAGAGAGGRRASATGSRDSREGRDDGSATPTVLETVGEPY